ncbi:amino acid adenylation domain-containing protein [Nocardiopsis sp. CC223A]|uniref:amino acid adenylation domain-containing protein n=1 Tax=Nocardiopsis sp. CC223A TaxID=3044051 RepID=UPI00278BE0B9|nr:amino acid adenylation domain-containing protein [Nocardiopsis sp. CC223A]
MTAQENTGTIADVLPLGPLQEGLLFHHVLADGDGTGDVYNIQVRLELLGPVDPGRLHRAATALLERHPHLRAGFWHEELDEPVQFVPADADADWHLTALPAEGAQEAEDRAAEAEFAHRFDLAAPPLIRFHALTGGPGRTVLLVTAHHILLDGWSLPLLVRDLLRLYGADGAELEPAPRYRDHLARLARRDREADLAAWGAALADLDGPTLLAPGADPAGTVHRIERTLDEGTGERLRALAARAGTGVNTVLQAVWGLTLGAATGRTDTVFGQPFSGRPADLPGVQDMIGLFTNTLPVRVRPRPDESALDLLGRLHLEQADLLDHQWAGLAGIQRAAGHGTLFDTLLVVENYPLEPESGAAGVRPGRVRVRDATHYPVVLTALPEEGALYLDHRGVPGEDAHRVFALFAHLLERVLDAPDAPLYALDPLTADQHAVLRRHNDTAVPGARTTLTALLAPAAAVHAESTAVIDGDRELTYTELHDAAGRLAALLAEHGAGPEKVVAVALPRGADLVTALLAVVRTGAAHLPLDLDHPPARLADMALRADAVALITDTATAPALTAALADGADAPGGARGAGAAPADGDAATPTGAATSVDVPRGTHVVGAAATGTSAAGRTGGGARRGGVAVLEVDAAGTRERLAAADPLPWVEPHPDSLAYTVFTSGSTGRPKGVGVAHRALANRLEWTQDRYRLGPGDRVAQKTPVGFDVAVWEFFWPLAAGAAIVTVPPGGHRDPALLADLFTTRGVTVCHFVPSMLRPFLDEPAAARVRGLRLVIASGEGLPGDLARDFGRVLPTAVLENLYGPTEAAIDVTSQTAAPVAQSATVPIGAPVHNTVLHVLDPWLRPLPPGVPGELYLGGVQLARGYVGRPDLTAERFVADPFGDGGRLYRTGDLVLRLDDGTVVHLGRTDDQVKINGVRVEPGEIEAALARLDGVAAAAVAVRPGPGGAPRITGYAVPAAGTAPDPAALREALARDLPAAMVPTAVLLLDALPLSVNGKLDRRALPAPDPAATATGGRPARTEAERALCAAVADILGLPRADADADFFALGGDSITAVRLVGRARGAGLEFTVRDVFDHRTPERLAAHAAPAAPGPDPAQDGGDPFADLLDADGVDELHRLWGPDA